MYYISGCGYNSMHPHSHVVSHPAGISEYHLILLKSTTIFRVAEKEQTVYPGSVLLIAPNVPYEYQSKKGDLKNDWLHFTCDEPETFENAGIFLHRPVLLEHSAHVSHYFKQLSWEYRNSPEDFRQDNIDMLMTLLRNNLAHTCGEMNANYSYNSYAVELQNLRHTIKSQVHKNYTADELADILHISPSYFQHIYKDFFGISFKADLINMRIHYAQDLLTNSEYKMDQIALMCGYSNEVHFYRQFRQKTGKTPKEYQLNYFKQN